MGWALGIFVVALALFQTRNLLGLRGWRERACTMSPGKRARDVAISFIIPTVILLVVFWQVSAFYGDRFNLWTNLAYFRLGLPDIFILMLVGVIPDYVQGLAKVRWTLAGGPHRSGELPVAGTVDNSAVQVQHGPVQTG
jgi:hypothetical protein